MSYSIQQFEEKVGRLEEDFRRLKTLMVEEYGKPLWKLRMGLVTSDHLYGDMVREVCSGFETEHANASRGKGAEAASHVQHTKPPQKGRKGGDTMMHALKQLDERVTHLEKQIEEMKAVLTKKQAEPWWKRISGTHKDDPYFDEIVREMRKIRRADYKAAQAEAVKAAKVGQTRKARSKQRVKAKPRSTR